MIVCGQPKAQYLSHKEEIDAAILRVLDKGRYVLGDEVTSFEAEFARYVGVAYGIGVGSGTEALHLALKACGIGSGDEVITVSHTAVATVAAIELASAVPVLVDIEPAYFTMDPQAFEAAITPRTKAVIAVHLYGQPVDIEQIIAIARKYSLFVVEDCAQAHGSCFDGRTAGSFGDISCFSFYPTKNLGAIGDAGMVLTDNADLAAQVRFLREYGWSDRYISSISGWNSRLDEVQAAILRIKLKDLDLDNRKRAELAGIYGRELQHTHLVLPTLRSDCSHVYHQYVIRSTQRDRLKQFLEANGVYPLIHYPVPIHQQPAYVAYSPHSLPNTELAVTEILSLPMYPELPVDNVVQVADLIKAFEQEQS